MCARWHRGYAYVVVLAIEKLYMFATYCAYDGIHGCRYEVTGALEDLSITIDNPLHLKTQCPNGNLVWWGFKGT